jgi:DNA-binding NarL/FixJ family response regulator
MSLALSHPVSIPVDCRTCAGCGRRFAVFAREHLCLSCRAPREIRAKRERPLTPRQLQLIALVKQAKSNKEIAKELCLTEGTVKEYLHIIFRKLHVTNRTELALRPVE